MDGLGVKKVELAVFPPLVFAAFFQRMAVGISVVWKSVVVAHPDFIQSDQHRELFDRAIVDGMLCIGITSNDSYLRDFEDGERPISRVGSLSVL